ncbi:MAG: alpha-glucosidase [Oscillospiraceae bacterium]|nr:alpha-glucosidase [Oscillospiraceae bacterium]
MTAQKTPWWKQAVIYQIYPRSFCDSNGDGIGDIPGIISKLDYLKTLGIDAIWLSPVFRSPQDDNGYDIADYRDIDPIFGTLEGMDELIREARERGIRIIMDLVLNHSSDEHRWFREAKKSRDNPYHDYYIWRDGDGVTPPNDLKAGFGGSAWEWVPELGQYYFHQFSVKQPDLNWDNPKLREELYDMINWWADRGIGGFRLDVVDHLGKDPDRGIMKCAPTLHPYVREMSQAAFRRDDLVTVGEAWSADIEQAKLYSNPDGSELSMVFQFEHMKIDQIPGKEKWDMVPIDFVELKKIFTRWQRALYGKGWNSLFWENHDLPRSVSRFADDGRYRVESAKMLAILLHGMQGTPYVYQGEELGMTNYAFRVEDCRDIEILNMVRERRAKGWSEEQILDAIYRKGRDNARTPMQWDDSQNAGFTTGEPWLLVNPNYTEINAADQVGREDSVFSCYRELIRLRKEYTVFLDGEYEPLLEDDKRIFAYRRSNGEGSLLVVANFSGETIKNPLLAEERGSRLLVGSYAATDEDPSVLRPYEAKMLLSQNR